MLIKVSTIETYRKERQIIDAKGDCAVRAFATFFDIDYFTARKRLNEFNKGKECTRGTFGLAIRQAAITYGRTRGIKITHHKLERNQSKVKHIVKSETKALIVSRNHASACMNGVHYGNLTQHEADNRLCPNDDNQFVREYYTMEIVDVNKYLTGGCV